MSQPVTTDELLKLYHLERVAVLRKKLEADGIQYFGENRPWTTTGLIDAAKLSSPETDFKYELTHGQ